MIVTHRYLFSNLTNNDSFLEQIKLLIFSKQLSEGLKSPEDDERISNYNRLIL